MDSLNSTNWFYRIAFLLCIVSLCILRVLFLDCDPPPELSASGGYFADEGFWTHNARNKILFGEWVSDEWNNMYVSPILHCLTYASFSAFGVSFISARLVPVVLSILSIVVISIYFQRRGKRNISLLILLFLGLQYPFLVYNRIAIVETPAVFFLVLVFIFAVINLSWALFLAGFFAGIAYITKTTVFFVIPALYTFVLVRSILATCKSEDLLKTIITRICILSSGIVVPITLWFFLIHIPYGEVIEGYNTYYRGMLLPGSAAELLKNVFTQYFHIFFNRTPVLLMLSHLYIFILVLELLDRKRQIPEYEIFSASIYIWGIIFLACFSYRPLRYYLPVVPAMAILVSVGLTRIIRDGWDWLVSLFNWKRFLVFIVWFSYPVLINFILLWDRYVSNYTYLRRFLKEWPVVGIWYPGMVLICILGIFLCIVAGIVYRAHRGRDIVFMKKTSIWFSIAVIFIFLVANVPKSLSWLLNPEYTIKEINRELAEYETDGVFSGQWAGAFCLETSHRVVPVFKGYLNFHSPFSKHTIRYLLLWKEYSRKENFFRNFPHATREARFIKYFEVKNSLVYFFEIPSDTSYRQCISK